VVAHPAAAPVVVPVVPLVVAPVVAPAAEAPSSILQTCLPVVVPAELQEPPTPPDLVPQSLAAVKQRSIGAQLAEAQTTSPPRVRTQLEVQRTPQTRTCPSSRYHPLAARFAAVENLAAVELEQAVRCEPVAVNRTILQINQGLSSPREPPPPAQSPQEPPWKPRALDSLHRHHSTFYQQTQL